MSAGGIIIRFQIFLDNPGIPDSQGCLWIKVIHVQLQKRQMFINSLDVFRKLIEKWSGEDNWKKNDKERLNKNTTLIIPHTKALCPL